MIYDELNNLVHADVCGTFNTSMKNREQLKKLTFCLGLSPSIKYHWNIHCWRNWNLLLLCGSSMHLQIMLVYMGLFLYYSKHGPTTLSPNTSTWMLIYMLYSRRQKSLSALQREPHISWRIIHHWYRYDFDWDQENIHQAWNFANLALDCICNVLYQLDKRTSLWKCTTVLLICEFVGLQNCYHPILNSPACRELFKPSSCFFLNQ
jgi:hypothetical protein